MNRLWSVVGILCFLNNVLWSYEQDVNVRLVHQWKLPEFAYPDETAKNDAIRQGEFIAENNVIYDADYHPATNRFFVTTPPFKNGTPSTLSEIDSQGLLKPFPTWSKGGNSDKDDCQKGPPLSVYRVHIDKCGLMWVPDIGVYSVLSATSLTCPPALWIYDLNHGDRLVLRHEFPKDVVTARSLPGNVITESYQSDCSDTFAYIADVLDHGLIVFDYARRSSWRIEHRYFYIFPTAPIIVINGGALDLNAGLCGLALGPTTERDRRLYFHSLASVHESWVPLCVLRNETLAKNRSIARTHYHLSPGVREGQSSVQVMTEDGILIYVLVTLNGLGCWNSRTSFTKENNHILLQDVENFQYISGLKLIGNRLVVMASRFANFLQDEHLNETDYNYRLFVIHNVRSIIKNSPCGFRPAGYANEEVSSVGNTCAELQSPSQSNAYTPSSSNNDLTSYSGSRTSSPQKSINLSNTLSGVRTTAVEEPRTSHTGGSQSDVFFTPYTSLNARRNNERMGLDFARTELRRSDDTIPFERSQRWWVPYPSTVKSHSGVPTESYNQNFLRKFPANRYR